MLKAWKLERKEKREESKSGGGRQRHHVKGTDAVVVKVNNEFIKHRKCCNELEFYKVHHQSIKQAGNKGIVFNIQQNFIVFYLGSIHLQDQHLLRQRPRSNVFLNGDLKRPRVSQVK